MRASLLLILSSAALAPGAALAADEPGMEKLTPRAAEAVALARAAQPVDSEATEGARKGTDPGPKKTVKPGELAARYAAPRNTEVFVQRDGSVIATLGDEHMEDLVAVRNPDGSMSMQCAKDLDSRTLENRAATEEK
jgi:hypothetical protein